MGAVFRERGLMTLVVVLCSLDGHRGFHMVGNWGRGRVEVLGDFFGTCA